MKLLIISYIYAPDTSPRAYRWSAIAEHLAAQGHQIDIVTSWKRGDRHCERHRNLTIYRLGGSVEKLRSLLGENSHRGAPSPSSGKKTSRKGWNRIARRIYGLTLRQLLWPDYAFYWYRRAVQAAKALSGRTHYDAMITVSHPFTGHLVGAAVKRARPELRWIADVGDPFSLLKEIPINNARLYGRLNRWAEAAILRRSDAVAVTVERCRQDYLDAFAIAPEKITVIPPLLSLPTLDSYAEQTEPRGPGIHLVFSGTLYSALRNPDALLALFARLRRMRPDLHLHFYGSVNDCGASFESFGPPSESGIHLHGQVSRAAVTAAMRDADILVNIGNSTAHQLPSKLVEYAAMARPILNLAVNPADSAAAFLSGYPSALTIPAGIVLDEAEIRRVLAFIVEPPWIDPDAVDDFLAPYGVRPVARAYLDLVASEMATAELCEVG